MKLLYEADWNHVVRVWLRSEGGNLDLSPAQREGLIDLADLSDSAANARRLHLLRGELQRAVIIDQLHLPDEPAVRFVEIDEADLERLYIVLTPDWYLDTGRTFRIGDTP